jgi:hypothetical protein
VVFAIHVKDCSSIGSKEALQGVTQKNGFIIEMEPNTDVDLSWQI